MLNDLTKLNLKFEVTTLLRERGRWIFMQRAHDSNSWNTISFSETALQKMFLRLFLPKIRMQIFCCQPNILHFLITLFLYYFISCEVQPQPNVWFTWTVIFGVDFSVNQIYYIFQGSTSPNIWFIWSNIHLSFPSKYITFFNNFISILFIFL